MGTVYNVGTVTGESWAFYLYYTPRWRQPSRVCLRMRTFTEEDADGEAHEDDGDGVEKQEREQQRRVDVT